MVLLLRTRLRRPEDSHFTSEGEALQVRSLREAVKHSRRYVRSHTAQQASSLTRAGLSVHMNQVHKENLTHVENAIGGRQGLDIEIFGMEGVPAEILDSHNQQVTQKHFAEEEERARLTGNPVRGLYANGQAPPNKRKRVNETLEEIEERANKFRHDRQNGILPAPPVEVAQPNPVRLPASMHGMRVLTCTRHPQQQPPTARPPPPFLALPPSLPNPLSPSPQTVPYRHGQAVSPASPPPCRRDQASARRQHSHRTAPTPPQYTPRWTTSLAPLRTKLRRQTRRRRRRARRTRTSSSSSLMRPSVRRRRWQGCRGLRSLRGRSTVQIVKRDQKLSSMTSIWLRRWPALLARIRSILRADIGHAYKPWHATIRVRKAGSRDNTSVTHTANDVAALRGGGIVWADQKFDMC